MTFAKRSKQKLSVLDRLVDEPIYRLKIHLARRFIHGCSRTTTNYQVEKSAFAYIQTYLLTIKD